MRVSFPLAFALGCMLNPARASAHESPPFRVSSTLLSSEVMVQSPGSAEQGEISIALNNQASSAIVSVYATPTRTETWGEDLLGSDTIGVNRYRMLYLGPSSGGCFYDVKVVLADGTTSVENHMNMCVQATWTITDSGGGKAHHGRKNAVVPPISPTVPNPRPPAVPTPGSPAQNEKNEAPQQPPLWSAQKTPVGTDSGGGGTDDGRENAVVPPISSTVPNPRPPAIPTPRSPAHNAKTETPQQPPLSSAGAEARAFQRTPMGHGIYDVTHVMTIGNVYPAAATLYSPTAPASDVPANAHPIKVGAYMIVSLTDPDNPGAFKIESQQGDCQFVPESGSTQWHFRVTPERLDRSRGLGISAVEKLVFTSYIAYGTDPSACSPENILRRRLEVDSETVAIKAFTPDSMWQRTLNYVANNPGKCLLYLFSGGAGIPGLAKAIEWLWKRYRRRRCTSPASAREPGSGLGS